MFQKHVNREKHGKLNKKAGKLQHSLRLKMTIVLILMMTVSILLCWFVSRSFLDSFFEWSEKRTLTSVYQDINKTVKNNGSVDTLSLERTAIQKNLQIMIVQIPDSDDVNDGELQVIYSSTGQGGNIHAHLYQLLQNLQYQQIFSSQNELGKAIKENGYALLKNNNQALKSNSIDLLGILNNKNLIIIDSSAEGLSAASAIATRFLAYSGIFITLLASFAMYIYTRRFTKPIEEMSEIADRMTNLDFDTHLEHLPNDEIGKLGNSINLLSEQLEMTITELKNANVELQKDNEKKTQIDEMRKEFLSHVSHELKTPIALIQGYAEGLQDNISDDPEDREFYCEVIVDEAQKMNAMVQKLMALNEIEFGQNKVEMTRFDLTELLKNLVDSNRIRFDEKDVEVVMTQVAPVYVWGDEFMIEDVITNYISNAYNHVFEHGKVKVWMEERGEHIRTWIYNDGNPIPEEELDKIWIKFYKVDKARTREYGGSGVGLSIVAATMDAHAQKYGAVNRDNGVAFYFELDKSQKRSEHSEEEM